jgi:hypothetical protein
MKTTAAIAIALCFCVTGCDDGKPIVMESTRLPSPDGRSVAIVEVMDNGLGFGQGVAYDEIHVGLADLIETNHGEEDLSAVFYASQESSSDTKPEIRWLDDHHLLVLYDPKRAPHKLLGSAAGVQIQYRPRAGARALTLRSSGRVRDKVPRSYHSGRAAQLNR